MHIVQAKGLLHRGSGGWGMNIYRGCTHGCIYCDSRSLCYHFSHPFTDVEVKGNAPDLLEDALRRRRKPCMIATGAMSDPYQPCEEQLGLTRRCLEIILRHGFGAAVLTKSDRILRDMDLYEALHRETRAVVQMTLTTWNEDLCRTVEPGVCTTRQRVEALQAFAQRGIPTVVWLSPILPFLNDRPEDLLPLLEACQEAGVRGILCFGMGLTLRDGSREYYYAALDRHFPGLKERYIRTYGNAYIIPSPNEAALDALFHSFCQKHGILHTPEDCFAFLNDFPERYPQTSLF